MKKIAISTMLLAFSITSFGQQDTGTKPLPMQTDYHYLKKSKKQKTWAWITTGVGVFSLGLTLAYDNNPTFSDVPVFNEEEQYIYTVGYVLSGACIGTGIVLFVASAKNKKKAYAPSVFIDMEKAHVLQGTVFNKQSFPAVGVKIHL